MNQALRNGHGCNRRWNDTHRFKIVRHRFDIADWIDRSLLDAALKDLQLQGFWTACDGAGKPVNAGPRTAAR